MTLLNLPLCVADNTGGRQGFNLIELVIVLALIAVLSATAMFFYQQYRARIYRLDAQQSLLALMQQQQNYYSQHQRYQIDMGTGQDLKSSDESEGDKKTVVSQNGYYLITVKAQKLSGNFNQLICFVILGVRQKQYLLLRQPPHAHRHHLVARLFPSPAGLKFQALTRQR